MRIPSKDETAKLIHEMGGKAEPQKLYERMVEKVGIDFGIGRMHVLLGQMMTDQMVIPEDVTNPRTHKETRVYRLEDRIERMLRAREGR